MLGNISTKCDLQMILFEEESSPKVYTCMMMTQRQPDRMMSLRDRGPSYLIDQGHLRQSEVFDERVSFISESETIDPFSWWVGLWELVLQLPCTKNPDAPVIRLQPRRCAVEDVLRKAFMTTMWMRSREGKQCLCKLIQHRDEQRLLGQSVYLLVCQSRSCPTEKAIALLELEVFDAGVKCNMDCAF